MRKFATATGVLAIITLSCALSCTPDSLEGFEPVNNANNANNANNVNNTNNSNNGGTHTAEFVAVSGIFAVECGSPACHGSSSANAFVLPTDTSATPAEMQLALEGITAAKSGMLLINPGNSATSDMYDRMVRMTSDPEYMPLGGKVLDMAQYTAVETWITAGAIYTE